MLSSAGGLPPSSQEPKTSNRLSGWPPSAVIWHPHRRGAQDVAESGHAITTEDRELGFEALAAEEMQAEGDGLAGDGVRGVVAHRPRVAVPAVGAAVDELDLVGVGHHEASS